MREYTSAEGGGQRLIRVVHTEPAAGRRSAVLFGIGDGLLNHFGVVEGYEKRYSVVHCDVEGRALFYVVDVYDAVVGDRTNLRKYGALVVEIED